MPPPLIHQPHDKVFKQSMSDLRVAKDFFEAHLPAEILRCTNLQTLKLEKHSFIDDHYKSTEADIIYSVNLNDQKGYFYLLCEKQSKVDPMIAFRLIVYTIRQMELHHKQHPHKPLPVVYPMVIYSGEKPWDAALEVFELFGNQSNLARQILLKPYRLIDIHRMEDQELQQHRWSGLVEFALKYRQFRDFERFLEVFLPWLRDIEDQGGSNYAKIMLKYSIDGIEAGNERLLIEKSNQYLSETLRGEVMTIAQTIAQKYAEQGLQQGMKKGLEQGIQKGIQQGMQQGMQQGLKKGLQQGIEKGYEKGLTSAKLELARKLLAKGLPSNEVAELVGLSIEALQHDYSN